jgi:hypothetical protein
MSYAAGQNLRGVRHGKDRPTLIVADDLEDKLQVASEEQRSKLADWFNSTLLKAGTPETNVIVVGTVFHHDSLLSNLLDPAKSPGWKAMRYQAVETFSDRADLWERWGAIMRSQCMHENETGTDAAAITNAPTGCTGLIVTQERFLFALGAGGNPRKVQWCDQENNTVWTPLATNQAGDFELTTIGSLQCSKRIRGTTILFTDVDVHTATYIGPPFIYSFERVGTSCGVISKQSVAATDNACIWMSGSGFWIYDGFVKPLPSDVSDFVFSNLNTTQASKIYCVHNSAFGEIWWYYPSVSTNEVDSYVTYNYRENHWSIGTLDRTCGTDKGIFSNPILVSSDGYVYEHEVGNNYDSQTLFAESGPIELGNGDRVMSLTGLVPDEKTAGDVRASFSTKFYPNTTKYTHGPYTLSSPTSVRLTGRQIAVKIEAVALTDWRVGVIRFDGKPGSLR